MKNKKVVSLNEAIVLIRNSKSFNFVTNDNSIILERAEIETEKITKEYNKQKEIATKTSNEIKKNGYELLEKVIPKDIHIDLDENGNILKMNNIPQEALKKIQQAQKEILDDSFLDEQNTNINEDFLNKIIEDDLLEDTEADKKEQQKVSFGLNDLLDEEQEKQKTDKKEQQKKQLEDDQENIKENIKAKEEINKNKTKEEQIKKQNSDTNQKTKKMKSKDDIDFFEEMFQKGLLNPPSVKTISFFKKLYTNLKITPEETHFIAEVDKFYITHNFLEKFIFIKKAETIQNFDLRNRNKINQEFYFYCISCGLEDKKDFIFSADEQIFYFFGFLDFKETFLD
ncbi:coiled-coil domain-containing protein [Helicobacter anseris]|nr:hypothetical protein [Helicobacter anseris]